MADVTFRVRLILRSANPRRDNRRVVMLCQFLIRLNQHWFVLVALFPVRCRRRIIRNEDRRNAAEELIHVDMCCNPSMFLLVDERFDEGILAVSHDADKDPDVDCQVKVGQFYLKINSSSFRSYRHEDRHISSNKRRRQIDIWRLTYQWTSIES